MRSVQLCSMQGIDKRKRGRSIRTHIWVWMKSHRPQCQKHEAFYVDLAQRAQILLDNPPPQPNISFSWRIWRHAKLCLECMALICHSNDGTILDQFRFILLRFRGWSSNWKPKRSVGTCWNKLIFHWRRLKRLRVWAFNFDFAKPTNQQICIFTYVFMCSSYILYITYLYVVYT